MVFLTIIAWWYKPDPGGPKKVDKTAFVPGLNKVHFTEPDVVSEELNASSVTSKCLMEDLFCKVLRILVTLRWVWIGSAKNSTKWIWIRNRGCKIPVSSELLFWCAEPRVPSPGWEEDQGGGIPWLQGKEYTIQVLRIRVPGSSDLIGEWPPLAV